MKRILTFALALVGWIVLAFPLHAASLSQRLVSPDAATRQQALEEFNRLPPEARERFAPDLMVALEDEDPGVRAQAKHLLRDMGLSNRETTGTAQQERPTHKESAPTHSERVDQLKEIRHDKQESFPDLRQEMEKEKSDEGLNAADLRNESKGPNTSAALVESLKDPDAWVRSRAARRLSLVHPTPVEAIPNLIDLLKDPDTEVRASAAGALGSMGPAARQAIPGLLHTLGDADKGVREIAGDALKQIQPPKD
jgi:HEAT repeat protein